MTMRAVVRNSQEQELIEVATYERSTKAVFLVLLCRGVVHWIMRSAEIRAKLKSGQFFYVLLGTSR